VGNVCRESGAGVDLLQRCRLFRRRGGLSRPSRPPPRPGAIQHLGDSSGRPARRTPGIGPPGFRRDRPPLQASRLQMVGIVWGAAPRAEEARRRCPSHQPPEHIRRGNLLGCRGGENGRIPEDHRDGASPDDPTSVPPLSRQVHDERGGRSSSFQQSPRDVSSPSFIGSLWRRRG
jgi:hypothetical protein